MKKLSLSLLIVVVFVLFIFVVAIPLPGWANRTGSPQQPVTLPASELAKIVDATGGPRKTPNSPPVFVVMLNNQSTWHITALEITVTNKNSGVRRSYIGDPVTYIAKTGEFDTGGVINPKTAGYLLFQIGSILSWRENGLCLKEFVFEPHEWNIVKALGYKG